MTFNDWDEDEPMFCDCGVTLLDGEEQCPTCEGAPHHRECPCDECSAYWERVCEESRVAAEKANRRLVCSCGWSGAFIEHHNSEAYGAQPGPGCTVSYRYADEEPERAFQPKVWDGERWQ